MKTAVQKKTDDDTYKTHTDYSEAPRHDGAQSAASPRRVERHCVICNGGCDDDERLSNGTLYHRDCYRNLARDTYNRSYLIKVYRGEIAALKEQIERSQSIFHTIKNIFFGNGYNVHRLTARIEVLQGLIQENAKERYHNISLLKKLYDFWPTTPPDWSFRKKAVLAMQTVCRRCGSQRHLVVVYKIPLSEGGSHRIDNLEVLCKPCSRK